MAEKKLNLNIAKSVAEFESAAKKVNLNVSKRKADVSKKGEDKSLLNKLFKKELSLNEIELLLKKWKRIFNIFLIFSVFMFIAIILIVFFYYRTEIQKQEENIQSAKEFYMSNSIHFTPKLNNSFFSLTNFTRIPEKDIQSIVIVKGDETCKPNIICKYAGYMREYDLSTIIDEDFLLDKKVINCYDSSNCVSNFTYLESSKEMFSRQSIRVERVDGNKVDIYDENDVFIAQIEKRDLGYIEQLYIWFKF